MSQVSKSILCAFYSAAFLSQVWIAPLVLADGPSPKPAQISYVAFNGKVVASIEVRVREIFDDPDISSLYRTANKVKINTREEVVRRELLLHEGDKFDDFLLKESERNLRQLGFLRQVSIVPTSKGDQIQLLVDVQDTWTFIPQFNYSSGTGRNKKSAGLAESNLLGLGKRAEFAYEQDDNRSSTQAVYEDDRVWGSLNRFLGARLERSDGHQTLLYFGRPFRSLVERRGWNTTLDSSNTVGRLFEHGNERYIFRQEHSDVGFQYTMAHGDPKISVGRYSLGYRYLEDRFNEARPQDYEDLNVDPDTVSHDPSMLADNRRFSGPTLGYTDIVPDYISMNYIDRFDRVADYNLGNQFSLYTQIALDTLGSTRDTFLATATESLGHRFSENSFIRGEIGAASRYDAEGFTNSLIRTELRYYNVLGLLTLKGLNMGRHTLAAGLSADYGMDLDRDREFLLGADSGLRGYEARSFTGDKRLVLNLEDRVHFIDDAYKLVSVGAAAFLDAGGTTDGAFGDILGHNFYSDVGVGLRIAFPRSTGSRVLRADIAFPMRARDDTNSWEPRFIISGGQVFDSLLRSELEGPERANVTIGFDR